MNFVYLASDSVEYILGPDRPSLGSLLRVKIGRTVNPSANLMSLTRANPELEYLHLWFLPGLANQIETALHVLYKPRRIAKEWFLLPFEDFVELINLPACAFERGECPQVLVDYTESSLRNLPPRAAMYWHRCNREGRRPTGLMEMVFKEREAILA
jgi:hypothetical protein